MTRQGLALIEVFSSIPDFRQSRGKRHSLKAILALATAAMLCGYRSYSAIAQWGRNYGHPLALALGFRHHKTPCAATLHSIFSKLDKQLFDDSLGRWAQAILQAHPTKQLEAQAIDGKTLRGSQKQGAQAAHLLSAISHRLGLTLGQKAVPDTTNEIGVVLELLKKLILKGRIITLDALLTQKKVAAAIVAGGGHYVMVVKANQPELLQWVRAVFEEPRWLRQRPEQATTIDLGHGRIEQREILVSSALSDSHLWPGLQQVFGIRRSVMEKKSGRRRQEEVYGVTSLKENQASASQLLSLVRGHWLIENQSHWVRDVTFDEDRSQVRKGNLPQVMATLRNTVIGLMRKAGERNIAAACRRFAAQPWSALALIGIKQKTE